MVDQPKRPYHPKRGRPEGTSARSDRDLALAISNYAGSMSSVGELFELVQVNVGDEPIDFTDLNKLQDSILIKEMARELEKLRVDFEQMGYSDCHRCGRPIERIGTAVNLSIRPKRRVVKQRDKHRIAQTTDRDLECVSLAIHTFLHHTTVLEPTLRCLFGNENDALHCYPYLDFKNSSSDLFVCYMCRRNYADLSTFLRHAEILTSKMGVSASVACPQTVHSAPEFQAAIPSVHSGKKRHPPMTPNQLRTDWMNGDELLSGFVERGDLVEIRRGSYTHWTVYIGRVNGQALVIHISTDSSDLGVSTKKEFVKKVAKGCAAIVRSDPFLSVASTDLCRVNNSLDASRRPFPPSIIVERALTKLGTGGYNIIRNNCEHFAKWCRYALRESDQSIFGHAGMVCVTAMAVSTSVPAGIAAGAASFVALKAGQALRRKRIGWSII
uniref:LRAT domain-containing protein n=1 Tax=Globodera rostochiensis TaxID=31243 RepID=A0A914HBJ2_GLORO